jgi:plastocyanin
MKPLRWVLLAAAGCIAAAACFSERGSGPGVSGAAECSVPVSTIDSMHFFVAIRDFAFHPDSLTVPVGATVTWVNCESPLIEPHTTTSDSPGWNSPQFAAGERFTRRFDAAGEFPYHCEPHPFMVGKVVVQ